MVWTIWRWPSHRTRTSRPSCGPSTNGCPESSAKAWLQGASDQTITLFVGLIRLMMLLIACVVALGVFNATLLSTREQVREIGILKAIGMAPMQVALHRSHQPGACWALPPLLSPCPSGSGCMTSCCVTWPASR